MPMELSNKEREDLFRSQRICHICEKLLDNENDIVIDHCHLSGKIR